MEPLDRPAAGGPSAGGTVPPAGGVVPPAGAWATPDQPAAATWAAPDSSGPAASPTPSPGGRPPGAYPGLGRGSAAAPPLPTALAPMTLSDLLDGAFRVLKSRPRTVLGIAASILVPVYLLAAFLQRDATHGYTLGSGLSVTQVVASSGGTIAGEYLAAIIVAASLFFLGGALGRLVSAWYAGGDLTAGEALGAAFRRGPALMGAFLMLLPLKVVSVAACYVGMVVVVVLFSLTAPAIVIEGLGPVQGARRSWNLITRRFWPALGTIVVATLGSSILSSVLTLVPTLLALLLPNPWQWLILGLVRAAVALVVTTTLVSVSVLLYLDLRIRTEGLDLELAAADAFPHGP